MIGLIVDAAELFYVSVFRSCLLIEGKNMFDPLDYGGLIYFTALLLSFIIIRCLLIIYFRYFSFPL